MTLIQPNLRNINVKKGEFQAINSTMAYQKQPSPMANNEFTEKQRLQQLRCPITIKKFLQSHNYFKLMKRFIIFITFFDQVILRRYIFSSGFNPFSNFL